MLAPVVLVPAATIQAVNQMVHEEQEVLLVVLVVLVALVVLFLLVLLLQEVQPPRYQRLPAVRDQCLSRDRTPIQKNNDEGGLLALPEQEEEEK